jgi:tetratricopeptide (TPR) repeat protein
LAIKLLLKNNQAQQALSELQSLRSIAPNDLRVLVAEGDIQTALGNFQAAEAAYNGAIQRLDPTANPMERGKILLGLAVAKYKSGDVNGANTMAEQQLKPINARLYSAYRYQTQGQALKYLTLARGYMSANMFAEAMENVNKAIEAGDKNNLSYKMQGLIYFKQGQMQQAIMAFTKAAEAERDAAAKAGLFKMMVKLQFNAQMYRECVATADNVLAGSQDPAVRAQINLMKAQALYQLGQYQAAIQAAQTGMAAITGEPQQAVYQFVIGMSAKKAGDVATARTAFGKAKFGPFKYAAGVELAAIAGPASGN